MSATTDTITIFDTTLRDGEQSPGCSMNSAEKLEVAKALVELGVDVIEAGFPIASPDDFEAVRAIAREFGSRTVICGLARCRKDDIDRAWEALKEAEKCRIHVFLATSPIHRQFKLKMAEEEILRTTVDMVKYTRDLMASRSDIAIPNLEFSPEDAARTELDFLCQVVEKAIDAGATTVNIPDTVGYATPAQFKRCIEYLKTNVTNINKAVISTHCHNDLGLAVANSLAGVEAGARQIECTINGLGERAGNAALEEVVMALKSRSDFYGLKTNLNTPKLFPISRLVSRITGMTVQRNKAIVGQNAFAHEAGIHQHGMLQNRTTYEIMRPEDVGYVGTSLVLGKHSGRAAFRDRVNSLGFTLDTDVFERVFNEFITLCDKKKEVYDSDIVALIESHIGESHETQDRWKLISVQTFAGAATIPTATVELQCDNEPPKRDAATGDGPLDAIFLAMKRITGIAGTLRNFQVRSVTGGEDAQGESFVEILVNDKAYHGKGISTDIIQASAEAYLKALNRAISDKAPQKRVLAQHD